MLKARSSLTWILAASALGGGTMTGRNAHGADITDVADAADIIVLGKTEKEDLFDLYVGAQFNMHLANGKITREPINRSLVTNADCVDASNARDCLPVDELRYKRATNQLDLNMQIGLFQDLALTIDTHYVFTDSMKYRLAKGVTPASSSVTTMPGSSEALFPVSSSYGDSNYVHQGWGNVDSAGYRMSPMEAGLRFAPLSDERDDSKQNWVVLFKWGNPWLADTYNPKKRASSSTKGSLGDGMHRLTFGTALSKRVGNFGLIGIDPDLYRRGYMDPYIELKYTVPIPTGRAVKALSAKNSNFGRRPSHKAEMNLGVEIVPLEDLKMNRRVAIDLGLRSAFYSEGRNYSILTDPLAETTYTEQFLNINGLIGLNIQAAEFIHFKAGVMLGYNTEHFVTFEEVGQDKNGDGQVLPPDSDPSAVKDVANPYFCGNTPGDNCSAASSGGKGQPSYDQVGFRFKDEEHTIFSWFASLDFTF